MIIVGYRLLGGGGLFVVVVLFVFCCVFYCVFFLGGGGGGEVRVGGGFLSFLGLTMCGSLNVKLQELSN